MDTDSLIERHMDDVFCRPICTVTLVFGLLQKRSSVTKTLKDKKKINPK